MATKKKKPKRSVKREDLPVNYWKGGRRDVDLGRSEFRAVALLGKGQKRLKIDDILTSASWTDEGANMSGTVSLARPDEGEFGLGSGDQIQLYHSHWGQNQWKPVWRMRIAEINKSFGDDMVECTMQDDLVLLNRSKDNWKFKKDKAHPKGWLPQQITVAVLRRYGIRKATLPKGKQRIKNLSRNNASPLDIIINAWRRERTATGVRFLIRMLNGRLSVTPLRISKYLYEMGPHLIGASMTETLPENFATVLTVRATAEKTKTRHKRKIKVKVESAKLARRYGRVHAYVTVDADSESEARREAKRILAKRAKPKREVTFTHPGIVGLRRGHALRLYFPGEDLRQVVFVTDVSHSVSSGAYDMEVTVRFDDPYKDYRAALVKKKKALAAKKRKRKAAQKAKDKDKPKPKRSDRRRN